MQIETWEFFIEDGNTPSIDNTIYFNEPSSIKFTIPGTIDGVSSGAVGSYDFASSPGQSYTLSAKIKAQGVLGTERPIIRLTESDINDNFLRATYLIFEKGTYGWTQKTVNVVTGANTAFVYIVSYLKNSYGTYWLDDVNITGPGVGVPGLTTNGKNYIAREWGINGCYVPAGLVYKAVKADGSSVIGGGDTAGVVAMIIQTSIYTRIDLTYPKTKSYIYSELRTANDGNDVVGSDAQWVALNDGYISPEQYCLSICPALSATLTITPTTIISGGSIIYMSTAVGGVPTDGFGHEILIDGVSVFNTGLGKDTMMTGALQITGISPGSHSVTSRITDGCLPSHQVATSPPTTLTVTVTCPSLYATLTMTG